MPEEGAYPRGYGPGVHWAVDAELDECSAAPVAEETDRPALPAGSVGKFGM